MLTHTYTNTNFQGRLKWLSAIDQANCLMSVLVICGHRIEYGHTHVFNETSCHETSQNTNSNYDSESCTAACDIISNLKIHKEKTYLHYCTVQENIALNKCEINLLHEM